jgi:hypothetical protein
VGVIFYAIVAVSYFILKDRLGMSLMVIYAGYLAINTLSRMSPENEGPLALKNVLSGVGFEYYS